jgi:hypothetical protein
MRINRHRDAGLLASFEGENSAASVIRAGSLDPTNEGFHACFGVLSALVVVF